MEPPPPQAVPQSANRRVSNNLAVPSSSRTAASPTSYGAMTGISFTNGGGFSFEGRNGVSINGTGATPKSYKRSTSGLGGHGMEMSPNVYSTSINMEPMSFSTSSQAFGLGSIMSSSLRRSYAAAVSGQNNLASSFASMSFQPQSLGTSYSRRQVHSLMLRSDNEIAKDYQCCGIDLPGIHALMEHVEDMHPDGSDPVANYAAQYGSSTVDNAIAMDMELEDIPEASGSDTRSSQSPKPTGPTYAIPPSTSKPSTPDVEKGAPFSPTSAWLKSEVLVSPAAEPSATKSNQSSSSSTPPDGTLATPLASRQHSPVFTPKIGTTRGFMGTGVGVQSSSAGLRQQRFDRAFNDVVTGKKDNKIPDSVAPGMLFATGPVQAGIPTVPAVGRNGQPAPTKENEAPLPAPSLFSPHKPWRCPTPGCNKAYKQSNGLKYHQQKGACDFVIHEAVDLGLSIEEAEERNRPYVCAVGAGCKKRYRQMNGLKYHYLNSGDHGEYGLKMLANQTHPMPKEHGQPIKKPNPPSSQITNSRPSAAPYHIPSQHNNLNKPGMPRMGVWPSKPNPHATPNHNVNGGGPSNTSRPNSSLNPGQATSARPTTQNGTDAVLYTNLGSSDPMDILSRME